MQTVERVFNFKEIPEERKVKLMPLNVESMFLSTGPICMQKYLGKEKRKSEPGIN